MAEGVLPVELPNYKKMSRYNSEVTKKRPEPQKAQTLPMSSKAPSLGGRSHMGQETVTSDAKATEDSDPDSEVERIQIALLEAKKKRAERKKARTVDDTLPRQPDTAQASNHPPLHPTGFPGPYPRTPWNSAQPPALWQAALAMPGSPMSPTGSEWPGSPASTGSGNFTYNLTSDCYNDNSYRVTKSGMTRFFLPYPRTVLLIAYIAGRKKSKTTSRDFGDQSGY